MVDVAAVSEAGPIARALVGGGARVLQVRMKNAGAGDLLAATRAVRAVARDATLIVNDRLDVALAGAADGVHLGQDDLPLAAARALAPPGFLVGISTHDDAQALAASSGGADYIGFGPIFPTRSKEDPDPVVGLDALARVCRLVACPVVAIGGIPVERAAQVAACGATAAAIISAVNRAPDVTLAARRVSAAFAR
jgi:thiamine-phosphate pyrophosphorylase